MANTLLNRRRTSNDAPVIKTIPQNGIAVAKGQYQKSIPYTLIIKMDTSDYVTLTYNIRYQWYIDNEVVRDSGFITAKQDSYTYDPQTIDQSGIHQCFVLCQNAFGQVVSQTFFVTTYCQPQISDQVPENITSITKIPSIKKGISNAAKVTIQYDKQYYDKNLSTLYFVCDVDQAGYPTQYTYQWYKSDTQTGNGTLISGATERTYKVGNPDYVGTTWYYCVVKNFTGYTGRGSTTSRRAKLIANQCAWSLKITSSGKIIFDYLPAKYFDVCCVGGGGGGGASGHDIESPARYMGGGGGGGGYTTTKKHIRIKENKQYSVTIGQGGNGSKLSGNTRRKSEDGGYSKGFGVVGKGGSGGRNPASGSGFKYQQVSNVEKVPITKNANGVYRIKLSDGEIRTVKADTFKNYFNDRITAAILKPGQYKTRSNIATAQSYVRAKGGTGGGSGGSGGTSGRGICSRKPPVVGSDGNLLFGDGMAQKYWMDEDQVKYVKTTLKDPAKYGAGGGGGGTCEATGFNDYSTGAKGGKTGGGSGGNYGQNGSKGSKYGAGGGGGGGYSNGYTSGGKGSDGVIVIRVSESQQEGE